MKIQDLCGKVLCGVKIPNIGGFERSLLKNEELSGESNFLYRGIYILCDSSDEIIYIGSAYARNIHARLLQYTHTPKTDTGNTLVKDLIDYNKAANVEEAMEYIKNLTIYAFENHSLEYVLINEANCFGSETANKSGN